jgi:hypothetical protein
MLCGTAAVVEDRHFDPAIVPAKSGTPDDDGDVEQRAVLAYRQHGTDSADLGFDPVGVGGEGLRLDAQRRDPFSDVAATRGPPSSRWT